MFDLSGLNRKQVERLWDRAWARMTDGDGYQPYGYDWPTVRHSYPGWYKVLKSINARIAQLNIEESLQPQTTEL
jgi:hypothetical protein